MPADSTRLGDDGPVVRHHVARVSDDHVAQRAVLPPVAHHLALALARSAPGWDQGRVRGRAVSIRLHERCTRVLLSASSACGRCGWAAGRCCRAEVRVALPLAGRQVQAPQPALSVFKALGTRPAETLIPHPQGETGKRSFLLRTRSLNASVKTRALCFMAV